MRLSPKFLLLVWAVAASLTFTTTTTAQEVAAAPETETATTVEDPSSPHTTTPEEKEAPELHDNEISASQPQEQLQQLEQQEQEPQQEQQLEQQSGPFIDLLGPTLLRLEMTSDTTATLQEMPTNDALKGKKVIGLYFSADWCGPCRQFTPELVNFYQKMNARRGKKDQFEIVWISRCRDVQSYGQYFTTMSWIALPPQEAMGERGQTLGQQFGVKSIPSLVLLDEMGNIITKDARNQIPKDKAGIGFPWRNPLATLYVTILPSSLRHILKSHVANVKHQVAKRIQTILRPLSSKSKTAV